MQKLRRIGTRERDDVDVVRGEMTGRGDDGKPVAVVGGVVGGVDVGDGGDESGD